MRSSARLRTRIVITLIAAFLLLLGTTAYALTTQVSLKSGDSAQVACAGSSLSRSVTNKTTWTVTCKGSTGASITSSTATTSPATTTLPPSTTTTPPPTTTSSAPPAAPSFVVKCGTALCLAGTPWVVHGGTGYGTYSAPDTEASLANAGRLNTVELVEFDTQHKVLADVMSEATWSRVDAYIAAMSRAGLHVILNLSEYGQSLQRAGQTPTTTDWGPYLSFIANRVNTVTGAIYKSDPTIAMVELFGEICYPGESDSTCPAGTTGTSADMSSFFQRTESEWRALSPDILISSGGFSHLNNATSSGIPWQTIVSDPNNAVCDLEVNSTNDYTGSVGKFTTYCQSIGEGWFLSAWSSCYQDPNYSWPEMMTDSAMADHASQMYGLTHGTPPATYPAVGTDFWNLRDVGVSPGHCDLGPAYPLTWAVIQHG